MTNEQRQEIMRRMNEGMCQMNDAQMAIRAAEQADGMRNAYPGSIDSVMLAQASMNFWRQEDQFVPAAPVPPARQPTMWARFKRWIRA